jgi:hypothetical protein
VKLSFFTATIVAIALSVGCALPLKRRTDPMTPLEQLRTSEAIAKEMKDLAITLRSRRSG